MELRSDKLKVSNVVFCFNVCKSVGGKFRKEVFAQTLQDLLKRRRNSSWEWKKISNYGILKKGNQCYVVFIKSGHVNSSGNKNFDTAIDKSLEGFNEFLGFKGITRQNCQIVNSTFTGSFIKGGEENGEAKKRLNFKDISERAKDQKSGVFLWACTVRAGIFPAVIFRHRLYPTALIFANGVVNIIGARSETAANETYRQLLHKFIEEKF